MTEAARAASDSKGSILLLFGEAGIGKTSLLEAFREDISSACQVYWGGCDALYTPRPFGPLHDMGSDLGPAVENLLSGSASAPDVLAAILRKLEHAKKGSVFVFEDVHWADHATLDVLKALGRRISMTNALLILSYRDDEVDPRHPLSQVLGDLPQASITRIGLSPLTEGAIRRLDKHEIYDPATLREITGGNPFFVTELLASQQRASDPLPASVTDSVNARLNRLSEKERTFLEKVSVTPAPVHRALLQALFGEDGELLAMACVGRNLLVEDSRGLLRFRHELARLATMARLSPFQRQAAHREMFSVLNSDGMSTPIDTLVHHAAGALLSQDVLRIAPDAARIAAAFGAHRQAADHLATALRFVDDAEPELAAELHEQWAYEAGLALQIDEDVIEARRHAITLWRALDRPEKVGDNLRWLSRLHWYRGEAAEAERFAREAVRVLETVEPTPERAMAYSFQSQLYMLNDRMEESIEWGQKALELAETLGETEVKIHALNNVGTAKAFRSDSTGVEMLNESLRLALEHGFHEHAARVYTNLSCYAVEYRDFALADRVINEGVAFDTKHDLDSWTYYLVGVLAQYRAEQGRLKDAIMIARGVLALDRLTLLMRLPAKLALARALTRLGSPDAPAMLKEALEDAIATEEAQYIVPARLAWLEYAFLSDNAPTMQTHLTALDRIDPILIHPWHDGERLVWAHRAGAKTRGSDMETIPVPFCLELDGDIKGAMETWSALNSPCAAALTCLSNAEIAPVEYLGQALSITMPIKAEGIIDKTRQLAAHFQVLHQMPKKRRGPYKASKDHPLGLTQKEQDVLKIMLTGATNEEISNQLGRSRRTIEHHVSSLLSKLNVANRMEAMLRVQNEPWIVASDTQI
jgi:ATP/maltotriose-dependent transcriptional regulator MalT